MVSGINSNSASLYERMNAVKAAGDLKSINNANIEDDVNISNKFYFSSKEDFINFCTYSPSNVDSLDRYISLRQNLSNTTGLTNEDYQKEYNEYMQSRGCSNDEELKALNSTGYATKNDLFSAAKMAMKGSLSSLEYCSGISVSDEQLSSFLSSASIQNIGRYMTTSSTTVSDGVFKLQTLLDDVCKQDNIGGSLKSSLSSLSNSISNASDAINKWSEEVDAYNKTHRAINPQSSKYNASLISNYQK